MMAKRIGKWAWALSADERLAAALVEGARGAEVALGVKLRGVYHAMLEKQKKLAARAAPATTGRAGGRVFQPSVERAIHAAHKE